MSITYYGPGEHPAGFLGFRVAVSVAGEPKQRYFSTRDAAHQNESDPDFKLQRLLAERQDTDWVISQLEHRYQNFVNNDHNNTQPERGVGVHGLIADFVPMNGQWRACFKITRPREEGAWVGPLHITFEERLFSDAWQEAVQQWSEVYSIRNEDRDRVMEQAPSPEQFKCLRRQMNEVDGKDIPIDALSDVYREQRERLSQRSTLQTPPAAPARIQDHPVLEERAVEDEITAWFQQEMAGTV